MPLTPKDTVKALDKYVIGQRAAKEAVACAMRVRWRRQQLNDELKAEITPKNIMLTGPTGSGKTEIARRLAQLADAPFIKVEATHFTEIGYVGRDVESIIRDLIDQAFESLKAKALKALTPKAHEHALYGLLRVLIEQHPKRLGIRTQKEAHALCDLCYTDHDTSTSHLPDKDAASLEKLVRKRDRLLKKLHRHDCDTLAVTLDIPSQRMGVEITTLSNLENMTDQLQDIFQSLSKDQRKTRRFLVPEALRLLEDEEADALLEMDDLGEQALQWVQEEGIVFLDEVDKLAPSQAYGADISQEGVQRDLLPLLEGCTVSTRFGKLKTDFILFISAGAFHEVKPSDLIPEFQARFPVRVALDSLHKEDFIRILTQPRFSLLKQHIALLKTEGIDLQITDKAIDLISSIACQVNEKQENIGARRLFTVLEQLLMRLSFRAPDHKGQSFVIDPAYVKKHLQDLMVDDDFSRYIL